MSDRKLPATIYDVPTPSFLVDLDQVKKNAIKMLDICKKFGVQLRPHMKTHKTIELGVLMTNGTKQKIEVSTLEEAEFYAKNGFDDILYAYPLISSRIERSKKLAYSLKSFHVMVDSDHGVESLLSSPLENGKKWMVWLEMDGGEGRTGVPWDSEECIALAKKLNNATSVDFQGLYFFSGRTYGAKGQEEIITLNKEGTNVLKSLVNRLSENGIKCKSLGMGCTPSCSYPDDSMNMMTEFHPGNYIFYDIQQLLIGSCTIQEIACRVATRVISHKPSKNTILIDCGFLALSYDGMAQHPNEFSTFQDHPDLKIINFSQEIGQVTTKSGQKINYDKYPIGSQLFIFPWHSCATACQHTVFYVHSGDNIVDMWTPAKGW